MLIVREINGGVVILTPPDGEEPAAYAGRTIPTGEPYALVDRTSLPAADEWRDAWVLRNEAVVVDLEKVEAIVRSRVNEERDRRLHGGFSFRGHTFQSDPASEARISAFATIMNLAIHQTPEAGDYTWGGVLDEEFAWIAADDTEVPMDLSTFGEFVIAFESNRSRIVRNARRIKNTRPMIEDFTDDKHWG